MQEGVLMSLLSQYVLEGLPEPVLIFDSAGVLIEANRSARGSLSADTYELFQVEKRTRQVHAFFEELASSGRASLELEPHRAGTPKAQRHLSLDGVAAERRYVVRVRDVTELRALERELIQLRRGAMSGLLAATVMHDFNNLLTPLLEWSAQLSRQLDRGSPVGALAADIESLAARVASMLRDARSLTETQGSGAAELDLNQVILQLRPLIERLFTAQVKLEFALEDGVGIVHADRGGLEHTLLNLLVNARNALPRAGHVIVSTRLVRAEYADASRFVSLTVSDTGVGMTEEVRSRAFEDFFTTSAGGTGLGLASVRRFARESGGTVTLDSAPARGTTVTVLLPRLRPGDCH
jgi:signal transduction histidine kinase